MDLTLGSPLPLRFMRYYASFLKSSGVSSALGDNWMHNFDARLGVDGDSATVTLFRGKRFRFTRVEGVWELSSPRRLSHQMVRQGGEYLFLEASENLIYAFSLAGRLLSIEDRNGNALTLDSSSDLGPTRVSDGLGRSLTFSYTDDKLTLVQDQTGRSVLFNRSADDLTSATDANGGVTTYEYTTAGERTALLTAKTLPAGNTPFTQEFGDNGRVIRQSDGRGNATSIDYDTPTTDTPTIRDPLSNSSLHRHVNVAQLATYTDPAGERSSRNYDAENRLTRSRDRLDDSIRVTYHEPSGRRASSTDALGNATTYSFEEQTQGAFTFFNLTRIDYADGASLSATHDSRGNVLTQTDQDDRVRSFTYNARGQQLTETNPAGGRTRFSYNADGTLASARPPSGEMTTFSYDEKKRLSMIANPDGTTRTFAYDDNDNLLNQTDERGGAEGASYDQNNQLTSLTDAEDNTVSLEYDDDQRASRFIDPAGAATPLEYDEAGRISRVTAPTGEVVEFTFDALNRLASLADCQGKGLDFSYDAEGVLSSVTDGVGRTWSLGSDKRGRITRITSPLGRNFDFTYDRRNRRSSFSNPLAEITAYTRDARGLVTGLRLPGDVTSSYERNELGRVSRITDPGGNPWTRSNDAQGRLTSTTDPLGRVAAYEYDSRDRVAGITFPEGDVTFTYDAAGQVTRAAYSDGLELQYSYDRVGRLVAANGLALGYDALGEIIESNGVIIARDDTHRVAAVTFAPDKTVNYEYDCRGLLSTITDWRGGVTRFTYDDTRQLVTIDRASEVETEYSYDPDSRLIGITERADEVLSSIVLERDAAGRIVSARRDTGLAPDPAPGVISFGYDAAGQLEGGAYDGLGRLLGLAGRTYTWDLADRLVSYTGADGEASFTYDVNGMRISKTARGSEQNYVWTYGFTAPAVSIVREGGEDRLYHVHLPDGTLLYSIDAADNSRRYYHFDETGSTLLLTDDSGAVTDRYAVTPYGEEVRHQGDADNPFTLLGAHGVMQEGTTGLYHMGQRYYDSTTARFLSRDPEPGLEPKALNRYQYALGNPLLFLNSQGQGNRPGGRKSTAEGQVGQFVLTLPELLRGPRGPNENIAPRLALAVLVFLHGPGLTKEIDDE